MANGPLSQRDLQDLLRRLQRGGSPEFVPGEDATLKDPEEVLNALESRLAGLDTRNQASFLLNRVAPNVGPGARQFKKVLRKLFLRGLNDRQEFTNIGDRFQPEGFEGRLELIREIIREPFADDEQEAFRQLEQRQRRAGVDPASRRRLNILLAQRGGGPTGFRRALLQGIGGLIPEPTGAEPSPFASTFDPGRRLSREQLAELAARRAQAIRRGRDLLTRAERRKPADIRAGAQPLEEAGRNIGEGTTSTLRRIEALRANVRPETGKIPNFRKLRSI